MNNCSGTNQYSLHVSLSVHTLQEVSQPLEDPGSRIVAPGVPFELPCPICQHPLEWGEYCHHHGITILCCGTEDSLEDHLREPFRHLQCLRSPKPDQSQRIYFSDEENVPPYPSSPSPPAYNDARSPPSSPRESIPDQEGQLHFRESYV